MSSDIPKRKDSFQVDRCPLQITDEIIEKDADHIEGCSKRKEFTGQTKMELS